jgi:4,5-epoxidase
MEVLEAAGVLHDILGAAAPVFGSRIRDEHREIARFVFVPPDAPWPHLYVFPQTDLERILIQRLLGLGVSVEWDAEIARVENLEDRVSVSLSDGSVVESDWLVGCDGAQSVVRQAAGIAFEGRSTGQTFYLSDLELSHGGALTEPVSFMGANGPLMLMPLPEHKDHWRVFVDVADDLPASRVEQIPEAYDQQLLDTRGYGPGRIVVRRSIWRSLYTVQLRLAETYRKGRILIAGDAAHVFPPFGGQGMNTGIQDAWNLGWKLALVSSGLSRPGLLDTYVAERRDIGQKVLKGVEGRRQSLAIRNPVTRWLRDALLRFALSLTAVRRRITLAQSQLALGYRGLTWLANGGGRSPAPGDRAPDGQYRGGRLMSHFRADRFTLIMFGDNPMPAGRPLSNLIETVRVTPPDDPGGKLALRYAIRGSGLVLVRPDGHVGWRGPANSWDGLAAWLGAVAAGG